MYFDSVQCQRLKELKALRYKNVRMRSLLQHGLWKQKNENSLSVHQRRMFESVIEQLEYYTTVKKNR